MNRSFKNVAFFFFLGLGVIYLLSDFLLHQGRIESETLSLIYKTFDMPFFFSAGMYFLAVLEEWLEKQFEIVGLRMLFWILGILWTGFLIYLNLGYQSML